MKATIEIDVADCRECPFAHRHAGHGECWIECIHPENGREPYEDILWGCMQDFEEVPSWCPFILQNG